MFAIEIWKLAANASMKASEFDSESTQSSFECWDSIEVPSVLNKPINSSKGISKALFCSSTSQIFFFNSETDDSVTLNIIETEEPNLLAKLVQSPPELLRMMTHTTKKKSISETDNIKVLKYFINTTSSLKE